MLISTMKEEQHIWTKQFCSWKLPQNLILFSDVHIFLYSSEFTKVVRLKKLGLGSG
jgi:predicted glycosyltransferase involved in capsule biosynthesis